MEARLKDLFKSAEEYVVLERAKGASFRGTRYTPLFDYFVGLFAGRATPAHQVLTDTYVTSESGTGIVHQAPYFGEDDNRVCLEAQLITKLGPIVCPVDASGAFTAEVTHFVGQYVKDADKNIIKHLKERSRLFSQATCQHQYPFCWRSNTPLLYKAVPSWFIRVEDFKVKKLKARTIGKN